MRWMDGCVWGWTRGGCGCGCGCVYTRGKARLPRAVPRNVIHKGNEKAKGGGKEKERELGFGGLYGMMVDKSVLGRDDGWMGG